MVSSIEDLVDLHESNGNIEDAYIKLHFDNKIMMFNKFTLRVRRGNAPKNEIKEWNTDIYSVVKKNRNLTKEVKEFISLFELLEKLKIKSGYIEKSETPDFILTRNDKMIGIEITKIYIGNDWVADKLSEEIKEFRLRQKDVEGYMEYKKYKDRVITYKVRGGLAIMPQTKNISTQEYIVELKNKIFTKVRKLIDDYDKFETNIIFVEVVSSKLLKDKLDFNQMCEELNYFVTCMEGNFSGSVAKVILKIGKKFVEFNLSEKNYKLL